MLQRKARRIRGLLQSKEHTRRLVPVVVRPPEFECPRRSQPDHLPGGEHLPPVSVCPALCRAPSRARAERDVVAPPLGDMFFLGERPPDMVARRADFCADDDLVGPGLDLDRRY